MRMFEGSLDHYPMLVMPKLPAIQYRHTAKGGTTDHCQQNILQADRLAPADEQVRLVDCIAVPLVTA